jgi:predicted metal-dependent phosphoesterase TrpH
MKDRSAITVDALLRLRFLLDHDTAANALQTRRGRNGKAVANLTEGQEKVLTWIGQVLDILIELE